MHAPRPTRPSRPTRTSRLTRTAPVLAATLAALLPASAAVADGDAAPGETTRWTERGQVVACAGRGADRDVRALVYENDRHGNVVEVVLRDEVGDSRRTRTDLADDRGRVRATIRVDGAVAVVTGTVAATGERRWVEETVDEDGYVHHAEGWQRPLTARGMRLRHGDRTVVLSCAEAFAYTLKVERRPS